MRHNEIELEKYGNSRPTPFDSCGLAASSMGHGQNGDEDTDRSEWLIIPVGQTRDSGCLDQSNFATAEKMLVEVDPEGNDHENHRFGHWGPGWFEILIVRPGTKAHEKAQEIACALANYPVLSDDDFSKRNCEEEDRAWKAFARRDMVLEMANLANLETDAFADVPDDALRELVHVQHEESGPCFRLDTYGYRGEPVTRETIRALQGLKIEGNDLDE